MDPFLLFMFHVYLCYAVVSVPCSLVITCWERAFQSGILGQVWYLIVSTLFSVVFFFVFCHLPIWCSESGMVLDCIDSRSLPSSLLWYITSWI